MPNIDGISFSERWEPDLCEAILKELSGAEGWVHGRRTQQQYRLKYLLFFVPTKVICFEGQLAVSGRHNALWITDKTSSRWAPSAPILLFGRANGGEILWLSSHYFRESYDELIEEYLLLEALSNASFRL